MARKYAPNRIKELRLARGLSLEALGAAMPSELTASTVAKLENGRMACSIDYVNELSRVFQVEPADIFHDRKSGARVVPAIVHAALANWREAITEAGETMPIPATLTGDNQFVVKRQGESSAAMGSLFNGSPTEGGFLVIDPDQRELEDGRYYAILDQQGQPAYARFRASPLALMPCAEGLDCQPLVICAAPFTVIGRVVYVAREI